MAIDLSTLTTGAVLPASVSNEIWETAGEDSVIMKASRKIDLPGAGVAIPMISGDAVANWTNETDEKPVSRPTLANKMISSYTVAVIVPVSRKFARDASAIYNTVVRSLPRALAKKFDRTAFGYDAAPGPNFGSLATSPSVSINTAGGRYAALVSALGTASATGADPDAWILSTAGELLLLGEVAADGRPLFTAGPSEGGASGNLLGRPVYRSKNVYNNPATGADVVGALGDFYDGSVWGMTGGIEMRIADQASLNDGGTVLHLFQRNMIAVLCEAEMGFQVADPTDFVKLTGGTTA
jgi:HK97 family phage major capsid protein